MDYKRGNTCFFLIVKLQSQVQTSVLGLGVDFVLPLSQQQKQEQQEQEQEEPSPKFLKGTVLGDKGQGIGIRKWHRGQGSSDKT